MAILIPINISIKMQRHRKNLPSLCHTKRHQYGKTRFNYLATVPISHVKYIYRHIYVYRYMCRISRKQNGIDNREDRPAALIEMCSCRTRGININLSLLCFCVSFTTFMYATPVRTCSEFELLVTNSIPLSDVLGQFGIFQ